MMLNFNSYEDLKDKLQIRIYDPDFIRNLLEGKVVTYIGDFALVYMATLYESEKKLDNLMFTPELMDALGIDIQTLHKDAMLSDLNYEPVLFTTEDLIEALFFDKPLFSINLFNRKARMESGQLPMLTLTKGNKMNGASMILHKSIRKKIGDIVGGNFYVLPSSIHEVMIIPEEGFEAAVKILQKFHKLFELVSTCNSELFTEANLEDILSDKVQWCSMDGEILRRAER